MSKEPSRLGGSLIVRKGEAAPAVTSAPPSLDKPAIAALGSIPKGTAGTIAVTVRLDPTRYERLKIHGARNRQTNQQIMVAALDTFLSTGDE